MANTRLSERLSTIQGTKSQNEFAREIGIASSTLGHWLRGEISLKIENLEKICEICNIRFAWLAAGEGPMYKTDQPYNPAITAADENKEDEQKQIEPLVTVHQEFADKTDQCCNLVIAALEEQKKHSDDKQEQIIPPQIAPQEPQRMPIRIQLAVFCGFLSCFFTIILRQSNVEFFKNYSVFGLLLSCGTGYFCIALPYIEKCFYQPPKNFGA